MASEPKGKSMIMFFVSLLLAAQLLFAPQAAAPTYAQNGRASDGDDHAALVFLGEMALLSLVRVRNA